MEMAKLTPFLAKLAEKRLFFGIKKTGRELFDPQPVFKCYIIYFDRRL